MNHKRKGFLCLALACLVALQGFSAAAQYSVGEYCQSTTSSGEVVPYTLYIDGTITEITGHTNTALDFHLLLSTAKVVSSTSIYVNLQKYTASGWTTVSSKAYYKNNCAFHEIWDNFQILSAGQYRIAVDYYADGDYVYDTSSAVIIY